MSAKIKKMVVKYNIQKTTMVRILIATCFWLAMFWASSLIGIERPGAVAPQLDEEDNPTYYMTYGKGDRIDPTTNKPLNLIQIYCQEVPVDMATDVQLDQCREDKSLVREEYGWMDFATYKGWRAYHAECHVCHGPDAMGGSWAPNLMQSMQDGLDYYDWFEVIANGRGEAEGAQSGNVMPAFGMNPNVAPHINDIYRYVKARADGKIRRGVRLPKLPKFKEE